MSPIIIKTRIKNPNDTTHVREQKWPSKTRSSEEEHENHHLESRFAGLLGIRLQEDEAHHKLLANRRSFEE